MTGEASRRPLDWLVRAVHLRGRGRRELLREALLWSLLAWIPLAAIALVERLAVGEIEPLLRNLAVHVRLLVAVPLALLGDAVIARLSAEVLSRAGRDGLVEDRGAIARLEERMERLRRSPAVEAVLVALALFLGQALFWGLVPASAHAGSDGTGWRGPAAVWYGWIAFPMFVFVVAHVLFGWLVWAGVLWSLARMPLRTEALHPDRAGGLAFLMLPTRGLALVVLGMSAVYSAGWGTRIVRGLSELADVRDQLGLWCVIALALAFGPQLAFIRCLVRTRVRGHLDYGRLGLVYTLGFRRRWLDAQPVESPLGTADIQSLCDLQGAFDVVLKTRIVPFDLRDVLLILVAVGIPMVPLLLTKFPLSKLLSILLRSAIGGV